jgi:hypothetical protein
MYSLVYIYIYICMHFGLNVLLIQPVGDFAVLGYPGGGV